MAIEQAEQVLNWWLSKLVYTQAWYFILPHECAAYSYASHWCVGISILGVEVDVVLNDLWRTPHNMLG